MRLPATPGDAVFWQNMSSSSHATGAGRHDGWVSPFFDPRQCPVCAAVLPARPLRCLACRAELSGPTVNELVTTLRRADTLVERMRADLVAAVDAPAIAEGAQVLVPSARAFVPAAPAHLPGGPVHAPDAPAQEPASPVHVSAAMSSPPRRPDLPEVAAARSWFAGKSVGVILLILGTLCVLAAGAVFIAVAWIMLPLAIRALILIVLTAGFGFLAQLALRRGLQATAEAMAVITCGMFVLDLAAARRAGLPGLADLAAMPYEILAGILLAGAAGAGALAVRARHRWLWSLDALVGLGMARAAAGALRVSGDRIAVSTVTMTVVASLLYVGCRHLALPVARWSVLALGGMAWLAAVAIGAEGAADHVGGDAGRLAQAWPTLTMALVAGLWSVRLTDGVWRRVAAGGCLLPVLMVFEIVAWSHGWVVGSVSMLAGYILAALAAARVPTDWSPAVSVTALILGLSSFVGLVPTMAAFAIRVGAAPGGEWLGPRGLPGDYLSQDVAPWLLPVTALVVLGLLPLVLPWFSAGSRRHPVDRPHHQQHTAGILVATLGILPVLYGAGFWVSMTVLVLVAAALLFAARLWRHDWLLVLALSMLVIIRVCAYYDDLADPLAWTLMAVAGLAWALTERRPVVSAGFLASAGLFALFGAAQWLSFARTPLPFHGLVIIIIGSLGLMASSRLRATAFTRMVSEGLSLTWLAAGLALADSSPSHRALELTVAGVAAGITAYLSPDRRRAGWVSGFLLTVASWIRLTDYDIDAVEWYTVPAAMALLVYGVRRLRHSPGETTESIEPTESTESSWRCLGPGLALALTPSLMLALDEPVSWRGLGVCLASVALVALGVQLRLAAPFILGVVATALIAIRNVWPVAAFIPRWTLLFLIGGALLWAGMTWESRVNDVRTASRYVGGLR